MRQFSPEWWHHKEITHPWCDEFCTPFYQQDPELKSNKDTYKTVGVVFFDMPDGITVPVGFVALQEGSFIFQYHPSYLADEQLPDISVSLPKRAEAYKYPLPAISHTLPKQPGRYIADGKLPPFFDNLPAEGWLGKSQSDALGHQTGEAHSDKESFPDRYHRLMMFGRDCPGAVWATYIHNDPELLEQQYQEPIAAALRSRSSIAGVQPKLLGTVEDGKLRATAYWETSTHIIKLPADKYPGIMENEYMSIKATEALLSHDNHDEKSVDTWPPDKTARAQLTMLYLPDGQERDVLSIERFDRTNEQNGKIHFEEMNQLLGKPNADRYEGAYSEMAHFVRDKMGHEGVKLLYARLVSQFILGNTDNHFKNFAMFNENGTWSLTPNYDLAPTVIYQKSDLALRIRAEEFGAQHASKKSVFAGEGTRYPYVDLNLKILVNLGREFGLELKEIKTILTDLKSNTEKAKETVMRDTSPKLDQKFGHDKKTYRQDFCDRIDGRCQQLFAGFHKFFDRLEKKYAGLV